MPRWIPLTLEEFWKKRKEVTYNVLLGPCWEWTGTISTSTTTGDRRGYVTYEGQRWQAHRLAYDLTHRIPQGMCVLHHCDNGICFRPEHLWHGTKRDNTHDMWQKGRAKGMCTENHSGSKSPRAKFTDEQVAAIRTANTAGQTQRSLAKEYNTSQGAIWYLIHRYGGHNV